jgi:putative glutamine amidotransferase
MPRPLIGLTTTLHQAATMTSPLVGIRRTYIQAVLDAGGLPVLIPPAPEDALRAIFARIDGLLLPGGVDIDPAEFGEKRHPKLGDVEPERDALELALCRWALAENKPLLGICRGIQVVNVAAGGALYQDIPSQCATTIKHETPGQPRAFLAHDVLLEAKTRLAGLVGAEPLPVNSWHHQAVKAVGRGLIVSARAGDGIVEALEAPERHFAVAVQFHPEDMYATSERIARLFAGFVAACTG